jgi:DNA-binding NarL/FixJ family response regulator
LVLYNQNSLDLAPEAFRQALQIRWPGVIVLPFGIFGYSDELFASVTGMDHGYFLRRRLPTKILEPMTTFWRAEPASPNEVRTHLESYFQKLIRPASPKGAATVATTAALSQRESDILRCLCAGHTDKTMAEVLGISVWAVHAHVKRIFEKLDVHTRAEAVMRYLETSPT